MHYLLIICYLPHNEIVYFMCKIPQRIPKVDKRENLVSLFQSSKGMHRAHIVNFIK